jgi:hypothetical protein
MYLHFVASTCESLCVASAPQNGQMTSTLPSLFLPSLITSVSLRRQYSLFLNSVYYSTPRRRFMRMMQTIHDIFCRLCLLPGSSKQFHASFKNTSAKTQYFLQTAKLLLLTFSKHFRITLQSLCTVLHSLRNARSPVQTEQAMP